MATFNGTKRDDTYKGTKNGDHIFGQAGNDKLFGLGGDDKIEGGDGTDKLVGGSGKDILSGGKGGDVLIGSGGNDKLEGDDGNDTLKGSGGKDKLYGGKGTDFLEGGGGNDKIFGDSGADTLLAGKGNDRLDGGADNDKLFGDKGDDLLLGRSGNDELEGGDGRDKLDGGGGDDELLGGNDADVLQGGGGNDDVQGGRGNDTLVYSLSDNKDAKDQYSGGGDKDTLKLELTKAEWKKGAIRNDVARYMDFLEANTDPATGEANSKKFNFNSFDLKASSIEKLSVVVDGKKLLAAGAVDTSVGEDDASVTGSFSVAGGSKGKSLKYEILSDPSDADGNKFGTVVNNGDGTFSFSPDDSFQFLDSGETHEVSFEYRAIDTSGSGNVSGLINDVTVTVVGADDAPVTDTSTLKFMTTDQSIFGPGDAVSFDFSTLAPELEFIGATWDESFNVDVAPDFTIPWPSDPSLFGSLDALLTGVKEYIAYSAWLETDKSTPAPGFTSPLVWSFWDPGFWTTKQTGSLSFFGETSGRVGLEPIFNFTTGGVDAQLPVDISVTVPKQVKSGESFVLKTDYSFDTGAAEKFFGPLGDEALPGETLSETLARLDAAFEALVKDGAFFTTGNPDFEVGFDFVFDFVFDYGFEIGERFDEPASSYFTGDFGGFANISETFPLVSFKASDVLDALPGDFLPESLDFVSVELGYPDIGTAGFLEEDLPVSKHPQLHSKIEQPIATLTADLTKIVSSLAGDPGILFPSFHRSAMIAVGEPEVSGGNDGFLLWRADLNLEFLKADLIATMSLLQDFTLKVSELPMKLTLEDGSVTSGLFVGDEITIKAPKGFDPDTDGDKDGEVDFEIDVDMDAVFSHLARLGYDIDLFVGILRATASIESDFFPNFSLSLFPKAGEGFDNDYLFSKEVSVSDTTPFKTLLDTEFDLAGFEGDLSNDIISGHFNMV